MSRLTESALREAFRQTADLSCRTLHLAGQELILMYLEGLTSGDDIALHVLQPLSLLSPTTPRRLRTLLLDGHVYQAGCTPCTTLAEAKSALLHGACLLLLPALSTAVAFDTKTSERRSPAPPDTESTVKGAKDAFTETLRTNTSLLRRHLRLAELHFAQFSVGEKSHTAVAVASVEGVTDPALTTAVIRRLQTLSVAGLLTPAAVEQYLTGSRTTAFPLTQFTERPDRFAQALLEGQVGVLVDGLPLGYLLPVNVGILMTSAEDRGSGFLPASCIRVLRYLALLVSLFLPALYIAMAEFHPAMIPTPLLTAIIESKQNVPFSTVAEVLALLIAFEILQEAGLHLPKAVGHTVSIVGGIVIGSAAVDAKLVSPTALIAVSAAGICGFAVPDQDFSFAIRIWRFLLGVAAALSGLYGMTLATLVLLIRLGMLRSCGKPYLAPFSAVAPSRALLCRRLPYRKGREE